jgi:DNA-binding beta-propeller fold protein YncE
MRVHLLLALAVVGGCHWALNDPGTDPPMQQLYFPAGIAIDQTPAVATRQYAFVSNANADLKFGGGMVQMIDVHRFECAVAEWRNRVLGENPPAALADPNCDHAQAANDMAQALCQPDPRDNSIVDCDETIFILQNATVKVGNFAGTVRLLPGADRLFIGVRGDPSVTVIDVHRDKIDANPTKPPPGVLDCFAPGVDATTLPSYDRKSATNRVPPGCDATTHLVQSFECHGLPTCQAGNDGNGMTQLPSEPFGMQFDESSTHLLVTHLSTGQVSLISQLTANPPQIASTSASFFPGSGGGIHGAFALARRPFEAAELVAGDPTQPLPGRRALWYLTSNLTPLIDLFRVTTSDISAQHQANGTEQIVPFAEFSVQSTFAIGNDVRAISFDPAGTRAFITVNNPPSVVLLDTHIVDAPGGGVPFNRVTDVVNVCQTTSHMGVRRVLTASGLKTKLVVVCFLSSQLMMVDPDRPGVDDTVFSGLGGPNDIAFTFVDEDAPNAPMAPLRHAWVTNFTESTISVVDLESGRATENHVIARLGFPPDGPQAPKQP